MAVTQDRDPSSDRRQADADPDLVAAASPRRRSDDWLRAIRLWCRARGERKSRLAVQLNTLRNRGHPHEECRAIMGLPVHDYARVRRWHDDAHKEAEREGFAVSFEEALALHVDRQVDLVSRFALLKRQGATRDEIRAKLGLTHDGYSLTAEWMADAIAATRRERELGRDR